MIRAAEFVLDLLFPRKCAFCHRLLEKDERGSCNACAKLLLHMDAQEKSGEFFSSGIAALPYEAPISDSIRRFKFSGRQEYAAVYAPILAACIRERLDGKFDAVTWVPVSAKRRRKRGYDQAELLARQTAALLGAPVFRMLRKRRDTPAQSTLPADRRRANVLGAYEAVEPDAFSGRRILLVDDVVTTGATASECSRVLRTAGAKDVVLAAFAAAGMTKGT